MQKWDKAVKKWDSRIYDIKNREQTSMQKPCSNRDVHGRSSSLRKVMTRSVRYQPILHTLYYTLHNEHAYCLSYRFLNNVVITTVIEMVEMVEILDGRFGKRSVERVRYVINNLLHLFIVKYGVVSLVLCISTRLRLVTILSLLVKYLVR